MSKYAKIFRTLLALVLVLASVLPYATTVLAAQDDSEGLTEDYISAEEAQEIIDNADYVIDANELINISELDSQSREDELEKKYEELANVVLYGEQALEEGKPKTRATNFVDYVFLNFEVGDPSRNFNWQTRTTTTSSRGYFSNTYMGAFACYYQGGDPSMFMPIETSGDGLERLGSYTIKSGDIAEVRIIDIPNNATNSANGFAPGNTNTFKSYFSVRSSANKAQYGTGNANTTLKYCTGGQTVTYDIHSSHYGKILYGVRWDPIQHTTDGEKMFTKETGALIYVDHIYVGPKNKRPVQVTFKNTAGEELITRWVGYGQNAYHWWHGESLTIDANAATHTIWGWEVYQNGVNTKRFVTDPTTVVCEVSTEFRLKSVTIPNLDLKSTQRADNGTSTEDNKYVLSVDGFDTAQITAGGYGKPIDFAILMDRSGSMGEFVGTPKSFSNKKATAHTQIENYLKTLDKTKWEGYYRVSGWSQCKSAYSDRTNEANYFYTMPLRYNRYRTDGVLAANSSDDVANWEVLYLDDTCNCNALNGKSYSAGDNMSKYGIYNFKDPEKGGKGLDYCPHVKWMSVTDAYDLFIQYRENTDGTYAKGVDFTTPFKIGVSRLGKQQEAIEELLQKIYLSNVNFQSKADANVNTVSIVGYGHSVFLKDYPFFDSDGDVEAKADYQLCHNIGCTKYSTAVTHGNYEAILKAVRNSYCFGQTRIDGAIRLLAGKQSYMQIAAEQAATKFDKTKFLPAVTTGRHRVVIAITDGMPTWTGSDFSHKTAGSAIDGANSIKNESTSIYTIGISSSLTNISTVNTNYFGNMDNYSTLTNQWKNASNFMLLLSSAYGKATWYPRTAAEHHTSGKYNSSTHKYDKDTLVTSPKYYYNDVDNAEGVTTFLDNIWTDTAPKLQANTVKGGLGSLWLYEEFGREWKLDTTPGAKINIYAEPYDGKGTYGTEVLIGSHPITEEVKSAMRDGEETETQVKVLIDPTQTQTMSNPGYTLTIAPTEDQGFTATLKWSDAKKSYIRNTDIDIGHVAVDQATGQTLLANYGYRVVMEIPVEVNRENTIGGNNIPLTKTSSGFFKADSEADTGMGDKINGYEPPNANVSYEITGEDFDYFMTMEEYVKAHSKDSATIENIYNNLVTFPDDPNAPNGIKLVNAQNRSRVDYVSVDYTISTEDNALVYKKSAAAKSLDYTVPTDSRTTMLSTLEKDTSFNAAATITPSTSNEDSFGRAPYEPAVAELNPNLYVPKFAVVDFDATATVDLQKEAALVKDTTLLGANGEFDLTAATAKYNFKEDYDNADEAKQFLDGLVTIPYTVKAINPTKDGETTIDRNVYILPANVVNYDETLFTYETDTQWTLWTPVNEGYTDLDQDALSNQTHGYDAAFAKTGDYHGNSMMTTVSKENPVANLASFEFFGTGFELLSRTAPDSGTMIIEVFKAKEDGSYDAVADTGYLVDTYLKGDTLYQVPIVQYLSKDTTPTNYKVNIIGFYDIAFDQNQQTRTVMTEEKARELLGYDEDFDFHYITFDNTSTAKRDTIPATSGAYTLYVDGCRVFNSMPDDEAGVRDYIYGLAGEKDANIYNINTQIVDADSKVDWSGNQSNIGVLYIAATNDSTGSNGEINTADQGFCLGMDGMLNGAWEGDKFYVYDDDGVTKINHPDYGTAIYYRKPENGNVSFYCTDADGAEIALTDAEVRQYVGNGERVVYYGSKYRAIGPENEVYLAKNQGVAFTVEKDSDNIFLGLKTNGVASMKIWSETAEDFVPFEPVTDYTSDTTMYFDISDYGPDIIIKNVGDGILSLCNIKCASTSGTVAPMTVNSKLIAKATLAMNGEYELPDEPIYDGELLFGHSLTLENDISINFIGKGEQLDDYDSFYLECKVPVYNGNELIGYETVNIEPEYNGVNYVFTLTGVTAKMMNDEIEAIFRLTKDGQQYYSKTDVYSIAEYAYGKLNAENSDSLKAVCADLLRYGAMAQMQFGYRTDALVDANMTDANKAYLTDLETIELTNNMQQLNDLDAFTVPWKSATLELGNKVIMCLIANLSNYAGDASALTMRLTYTDRNGETVTAERPLELYNEEKQFYAVSFDGLRATEMRTIVSAAIYEGETRVSKTVEYSVESYAARNPSDLTRAMLAYGDSANAFFAN